jgi:hypothetical protein
MGNRVADFRLGICHNSGLEKEKKMANPTSAFGWQMPTSTDLVTDLPADFEVFGQAVDTSLADLKGGTTGQILSKASATDMDFTWTSANPGDITAVTVSGNGLTGGGTSGSVNIAIDYATLNRLTFNAQTGTTYTLVVGDAANVLVTTSNAAAITVTVPPSVFSAGDQINVQSIGVGLTTFAQGAGVTITSTGATSSAPVLRARYSAATIICTASNDFTIMGDLA